MAVSRKPKPGLLGIVVPWICDPGQGPEATPIPAMRLRGDAKKHERAVSSCLALSRASTSLQCLGKKDVDGRDDARP